MNHLIFFQFKTNCTQKEIRFGKVHQCKNLTTWVIATALFSNISEYLVRFQGFRVGAKAFQQTSTPAGTCFSMPPTKKGVRKFLAPLVLPTSPRAGIRTLDLPIKR